MKFLKSDLVMSNKYIEIKGARVHNLKNISLKNRAK